MPNTNDLQSAENRSQFREPKTVGSPALKQTSFDRVIAEWLQTDSAAARQYVSTAPWLDDSARSKILGAGQ